jgi:hypothetical protein
VKALIIQNRSYKYEMNKSKGLKHPLTYYRLCKLIHRKYPDFDLECIDRSNEYHEEIGRLEKTYHLSLGKEVVCIGGYTEKDLHDLEQQQLDGQDEAELGGEYLALLEEASYISHRLRKEAIELVPKMVEALTKQGMEPMAIGEQIVHDLTMFGDWKENTITKLLPAECKDQDKSRAAKIGNAKRKQQRQLQLPDQVQALAKIETEHEKLPKEHTFTVLECHTCVETMKYKEGFGPINTYYECPRCKCRVRLLTKTLPSSLTKYFESGESNLEALHRVRLVDDKLFNKLNKGETAS